jgi:hypothetical protein
MQAQGRRPHIRTINPGCAIASSMARKARAASTAGSAKPPERMSACLMPRPDHGEEFYFRGAAAFAARLRCGAPISPSPAVRSTRGNLPGLRGLHQGIGKGRNLGRGPARRPCTHAWPTTSVPVSTEARVTVISPKVEGRACTACAAPQHDHAHLWRRSQRCRGESRARPKASHILRLGAGQNTHPMRGGLFVMLFHGQPF